MRFSITKRFSLSSSTPSSSSSRVERQFLKQQAAAADNNIGINKDSASRSSSSRIQSPIEEVYGIAERKAKESKWRDAIFLYKKALRLQQDEYGHVDRRVARTFNDIGVAMSNLSGEKNHIEALRCFREALVIQRQILTSDSDDDDHNHEMSVTATNMTQLMEHMKRVACAKGEIPFTPCDSSIV